MSQFLCAVVPIIGPQLAVVGNRGLVHARVSAIGSRGFNKAVCREVETMGIDLNHLREWVGKSQTQRERLHPFPANALSATLDRDDPLYEDGASLPPLWQWLHFLPVFKMSDCGEDGHAALGGFLPPVPLAGRMWAGSRLKFHAPMTIGNTLTKTSTVRSVDHKSGRSGDLVFVTVNHRIEDRETLLIDEEHDIVYRAPPPPGTQAPPPKPAPEISAFSRTIDPNPVLLFRFSALTFNGHRIHYDWRHATAAEGHAGLIVHGPLLAILLLDLLHREMPNATITKFEFRATAPVYEDHEFTVHGAPAPGGETIDLWVRRHDGALAMKASAQIGEPQL